MSTSPAFHCHFYGWEHHILPFSLTVFPVPSCDVRSDSFSSRALISIEGMQHGAAPNPAFFGSPFAHWRLWLCSLTLRGAVRPHYALWDSRILWLERQLQNKGQDTKEVIMDGKQIYLFFSFKNVLIYTLMS